MTTFLIYYAVLIIILGLVSLILFKNTKLFSYYIPSIAALTSLVILILLLGNLGNLDSSQIINFFDWHIPFGSFKIGLDGVSSIFLIPLMILSVSAFVYSTQYMGHKPNITHWLSICLLIAGMVLVLLARNMILFLLAWELMSAASFFLVITHSEKAEVLRSGWIYFIATHIGTAFLITAFLMLAQIGNSFDFGTLVGNTSNDMRVDLIFLFALIGFGLKAGFIPFHFWLPLAHPVAPSHVSALMSGIMIKMGIYGIFRILLCLSCYHAWWGILLIILGAVSGIVGVLFAIGQHDIKRLLAYHSVENIGIILIGMGVAVMGMAYNQPLIAMLGFIGCLLHVINHALFKALLFFGAGAVIRQTGTGTIDDLGGLLKKMPWTASLFLLGSMAITGLPFLNGFISEIFIYAGAVTGTVNGTGTLFPFMNFIAVISLALIGGLAGACFTKVFGIVFLGSSRKKNICVQREIPWGMRSGMLFLGLFIVFIGMCNFAVIPLFLTPLKELTSSETTNFIVPIMDISVNLSLALAVSLVLIILIFSIRFIFLRRNKVTGVGTWGCGYTKPDESMQYTATSFAEPFTKTFKNVLDSQTNEDFSEKIFPSKIWKFHSHVNDWMLNNIYIPSIKFIDKLLSLFRWIQCGKTGVYILYMIATLIALIIWMFLIWKK